MTPKQVERLEKTLGRVAREQGLDQERLRRWVSFLALCGVLESAVEKGVIDISNSQTIRTIAWAADARQDRTLPEDGTAANRGRQKLRFH